MDHFPRLFPLETILQDDHNISDRLCTKGGFWELQRDIPIGLTLETMFKIMM